jgi:glycosyltransferase involved in cell wall biosynthesis
MEPKVSVVIPSYNHGHFLLDSIHSLIGGDTSLGVFGEPDLKDIEIIICDDCSTDNTEEIVNSVKDSRVRYAKTDSNSGTPIANNLGLKLASAEAIAMMSADDMRESWSLQTLYETWLLNKHSFIYDDICLIINGVRAPKIWKFPEYDFLQVLQENRIHAGIMFPRQAVMDTGGYPTIMKYGREDWAFNVLLGVKGYCGVHVAKPGYLYRRHTTNRTLINKTDKWKATFKSQMLTLYADLYSGRFPMGCCGQRYSVTDTGVVMKSSEPEILVGAEGMSLVEYLGGNVGTQTFYGPITGSGYPFSSLKNHRYVDNRDLHTNKEDGLLDLRVHTKAVFKVIPAPVEEPAKEPEPVIEEIVPMVEEQVIKTEPELPADTQRVMYAVVHPISEMLSEDSPNYAILMQAGYDNIEAIAKATVEELVIAGLSKTSAKAIRAMAIKTQMEWVA